MEKAEVSSLPAASATETQATDTARDEAISILEKSLDAPETIEQPAPQDAPAADTADTAEAAPAASEDENRIAVVMRARKQAQKVREDAEASAVARMRDVERKERELSERESLVKSRLRSAPLEALRELGIDPREFFETAIKDPEKLEPVAQVRAELEALKRQNQELVELFKKREEDSHRSRIENQREAVRQQFVGETLGNENFRALKAFYGNDPAALVRRAESLIQECVSRGMNPKEIQNSEIAEYLEQEAKEHYNSLRSQLEHVGGEATQLAGGNVSLSAKSASQKIARRKKAPAEMSGDEARAEAVRILEDEMSGRIKPTL